ncbi:MAG: hypothetical protein PHP73_03810 [Candidatus Omnitrophica bacterium]|nr:hypothetical protein [Candidatus Omnitrophota bacterium]
MPDSGFVWIGGSGCLLPFLIIFNLFFGRFIFNSTRLWLGIEAILILMFIISINIMRRKIIRQFGQQGRGFASDSKSYRRQGRGDGKVVDIQGQIVGEDMVDKAD